MKWRHTTRLLKVWYLVWLKTTNHTRVTTTVTLTNTRTQHLHYTLETFESLELFLGLGHCVK